jgi:ferrous iron transport protein B
MRYGPDLDPLVNEIAGWLERTDLPNPKRPSRWMALKLLEGDPQVRDLLADRPELLAKVNQTVDQVTRHLRSTLDDGPDGVIADHRYGFITSVTKQAVTVFQDLRRTISDKVDMLALNRLVGPILLLVVLYGIYQFVFITSETPVAWLEAFFGWLSRTVQSQMADGPLRSLLTSGIIDGVGGVLGFVPLIAFMFFAIALLEDSGYMARMAFIMDRVLRTFGLHGNSMLALMIGGGLSGGCAVPGVMAARTLRDPKERLATILVTPFMNCGAKLPVFAVLIAAFFSNRQGSMMFLLTLIAWTLALVAARILRWTVLRGDHSPFVMELPPYRLPTLKGLLIHTWERVWQYIKKAGTIILAISIVMWALMSYPEPPREAAVVFDHQAEALDAALAAGPAGSLLKDESARSDFVKRLEQLRSAEDPLKETASTDPLDRLAKAVVLAGGEKPLPPDLLDLEPAAQAYLGHAEERAVLDSARAAAGLRFSAAGRVGVALEAISRPLGFDWRTNIALAGGFAAKEVVIATLGTAYSLGDVTEDEGSTLAVKLASEPGWSPLQALTLMIFVMMYAPCLVTVVTIVREAGAKWAVFSVCYTTIAAYGLALIVRQVGLVLGF